LYSTTKNRVQVYANIVYTVSVINLNEAVKYIRTIGDVNRAFDEPIKELANSNFLSFEFPRDEAPFGDFVARVLLNSKRRHKGLEWKITKILDCGMVLLNNNAFSLMDATKLMNVDEFPKSFSLPIVPFLGAISRTLSQHPSGLQLDKVTIPVGSATLVLKRPKISD